MYNITFDASDVSLNLTDVNEGENQAHGFSVYNLFPDLPYIWPLYRLPSGRTVAGVKKTLEAANYTSNSFHVDFPNCLLTEHGRVLVQIVATDANEESVATIFDAYAAGTFADKIVKSRVYEFYANESIDALQEMAAPSGGISQAVKDYIEDLVDEIIEGGGSVDPAVLNTKMDKANPTGSGAISVGRKANTTVGENSVALGGNVEASGTDSVALGANTKANAYAAHAEGESSIASGSGSHAEGGGSEAKGAASHAEGLDTIAGSDAQHVQGKYNVEDEDERYAHIIGNGSSITNRSNAHTVDWHGNAWYSGDVRVGGADYDHGAPLAKATSVNLYNITHPGRAPEMVTDILYDVSGTASQALQCDYFTDLTEASDLFQSVLSDDLDILCYGALGTKDVKITKELREAVDTDPEGDGVIDVGYWLLINAERWTSTGNYLAQFKIIDSEKPVYILSVLYDGTVELFTSNLTGLMALVYKAYGTTAVEEELAYVAFSGDYDDLKNKPDIPEIPTLTLYTDTATLQEASVAVLYDSSEQLITTYADTSLSAASDDFVEAITEQTELRLGDYPLTKTPVYDPDDGTTLVRYALTYNATPMGDYPGVQWKKIDDSAPIIVLSVAVPSKAAQLYSSIDQVNLEVVCDDKYVSETEMNAAIRAAIGNAIGGSY